MKSNHKEYKFDIEGKNIYLIYPSTFVNNSGIALMDLLNKNKFILEETIIISDDIKLDEGKIRIKRKGSSGGHNGLKSIINHLGSENFIRLKIGVGKPWPNEDQIKFVLSKVKNLEVVQKTCEEAADAILSIINNGINKSMEKYNGDNNE